jgi:hypothetical protein
MVPLELRITLKTAVDQEGSTGATRRFVVAGRKF